MAHNIFFRSRVTTFFDILKGLTTRFYAARCASAFSKLIRGRADFLCQCDLTERCNCEHPFGFHQAGCHSQDPMEQHTMNCPNRFDPPSTEFELYWFELCLNRFIHGNRDWILKSPPHILPSTPKGEGASSFIFQKSFFPSTSNGVN